MRNPEFNPPTSPARPPPALPRKSYSGVSEPLAGVALPTVPPRPPKISTASRSVSGTANFAIGTTGLKNLGNTCYMNSVLQCMSGTVPLSRYFLDGSYKSHINRDNPLGSGGVLAEAFAGVIRNLWSGEYGFIAPQTMKVGGFYLGFLANSFLTHHRKFRVGSTRLSDPRANRTHRNFLLFCWMDSTRISTKMQ